MATHVHDVLRVIGSYLSWRELIQTARVNTDFKKACEKELVKYNLPRLKRISTHLIEYTPPDECVRNGMYVYLSPWERNCVVWTPFFSVNAIIGRGKKFIIPRRAIQDRCWKQWLMRLAQALHVGSIHPYVVGKGEVDRKVRMKRALVSFRIQNNSMKIHVLKLSPARPI